MMVLNLWNQKQKISPIEYILDKQDKCIRSRCET